MPPARTGSVQDRGRHALLLGESWTTHSIHQKGFDSFTSTTYVEGGQEFRAALESAGWTVTHIPAHGIETSFPTSLDELRAYDLVVISDVGANTFLLTAKVFAASIPEPNRLALIRQYVEAGGGLLMVGGYLSFAGIDGKANYANSPLGEILPVEVMVTDDREERPEGAAVTVLEPGHAALGGVGTEWPALLGFNRTLARAGGTVLVEVGGHPLVAVREVGAGRTGVFTSDMSPHWAPPEFMQWAGYAPLWCALSAWVAGTGPRAGATGSDGAGPADPLAEISRRDPLGAFVDHGRIVVHGSDDGPLRGIAFAAKDSFDVAGVPTGNGNPTWAATHPVPTAHSPAVQRVLDAGAVLVGKTHMDELGWSLNGVNQHHPIPINPAAPDRIPGGSSSGSVAVVAGDVVPFALAADGAGSIRIPASYCGVLGIRPTHGRVADPGSASSYGVIGWFARDVDLFARLAPVVLDEYREPAAPSRLLLGDDLFAAAGDRVREACRDGVKRIEEVLGAAAPVRVADAGLESWRETFRITQAAENLRAYRDWVLEARPDLGPDIRGRFEMATALTPEEVARAQEERAGIRRSLHDLLGDGAVIVAPTAPGIAPLRTASWEELDAWRARALMLLCPAGLAGLPQISLPLAELDGCPLGVSLIAGPGNDEMLLDIARQVLSERTV